MTNDDYNQHVKDSEQYRQLLSQKFGPRIRQVELARIYRDYWFNDTTISAERRQELQNEVQPFTEADIGAVFNKAGYIIQKESVFPVSVNGSKDISVFGVSYYDRYVPIARLEKLVEGDNVDSAFLPTFAVIGKTTPGQYQGTFIAYISLGCSILIDSGEIENRGNSTNYKEMPKIRFAHPHGTYKQFEDLLVEAIPVIFGKEHKSRIKVDVPENIPLSGIEWMLLPSINPRAKGLKRDLPKLIDGI